jgi:hypothetical protein
MRMIVSVSIRMAVPMSAVLVRRSGFGRIPPSPDLGRLLAEGFFLCMRGNGRQSGSAHQNDPTQHYFSRFSALLTQYVIL